MPGPRALALVTDASRRDTEDEVRRFAREPGGAAAGLFHFSGHGVQIDGENYLIPIDASLEREADAKYGAVNLSWGLGSMKDADAGFNFVILLRLRPVGGDPRPGGHDAGKCVCGS